MNYVSVFKNKQQEPGKQIDANPTISAMVHFAGRRTDGKKLPPGKARLLTMLLVLLAATSAHAQPAPPAITVNPASLNFYAAAGQAAPAAIPVSVSSPAAGSTYTASSNQPWLTPMPISNATGGATTVHLSATAASLPAGVYTGTVSFTAPNFLNATTAVTLSVANPSGTLATAPASPFAVGAAPQSIAAGDFNGDGNPDVVTANSVDNTVTVLLGDGASGFTAAAGSPFAVGPHPQSVAVADFNRDGNLDVVTANSVGSTVSVLLGNGAGGFTAAAGSPFAVGTNPQSVAVADFNGDGKPDIVTANNGANDVTVLLGDGTGGFAEAPGSPFPVGLFPQSVAVRDFNGDGKPDIVTVNSGNNTARILMGNGSGGFTGGGAFPVGSFPQSVAVADLNGDGKPDIVTANSGSNTVTVLLGSGSGTFTPAAGSPFAVGPSPQSVAVVDINGDGKPDIVTANAAGNTVTVLLGSGLGTFAAAVGGPFAAGATPISVASADFNGDGRSDIAIANIGAGSVTLLLGMQAASSSVLSTTAGSTITYGTSVPLTLKVPTGGFDAPTGSAEFLDGGVSIGTAVQTSSPWVFAATGLAAGIHMLTAAYGGDSATAASSSNTVALTVTPSSQTITFGVLSNKALGFAPFTLSATASSSLAVDFTSTTLPVCTVSGGIVTLIAGGTCTIQAMQAGNANYAAAPPLSQHFSVTLGSQAITFGVLPDQPLGTAPFDLTATATSGLDVSFVSTTLPVCTVSGATVTLLSVGACTIQASQAGDSSYATAPLVSRQFKVTPAIQTIAFGALLDQIFGTAPLSLTATSSSGLTVTFTSTTLSVCTISGVTLKLLTAGACTIRASQAGNSNFASAAPVIQSFNVNPELQSITFGALPDQPFKTATFTVSATASSTLAVGFSSATPLVCTVAVATVTLVSVGSCTIEASQAGNSAYAPATPVEQTFTVTQASQTITFAALSNKAFGSPAFTLAATASSGLPVTFASNSAVCAVSGATVTLAIGGTCTIQASQPGNANFTAATAVPQSFTVTPATQTITFGALANQVFGAALAVSATATSGLAVSFLSTTLPVCTVSAATVTLVTAGTCTIQAIQPGNSNYAPAPSVSQHFTVMPASQTITFGAISNQSLGTGLLPLNATASSGLAVTFKSATLPVCTVSASILTLLIKGTCSIQALQAGNTNYTAAAPVVQTFSVTAGVLTIGSVLNAGSYAAIPIAADGYTVAFGTNFSTTAAQTPSLTFPTTLAGASVAIADATGVSQPAPLFYVSPTQINFLVPEGLASGSATITVTNPAGVKVSFATTIAQVSPALFTADSSGKGAPAAIALAYAGGASAQVVAVFNCNGPPLVCTSVPIDLGPPSTSVYLELYGTGVRGRTDLSGVSVTLGGTVLQVSYAGAQGTYAGLDQVNVLLDRSLIGGGPLTLQLTVDGVAANPVVVNIR